MRQTRKAMLQCTIIKSFFGLPQREIYYGVFYHNWEGREIVKKESFHVPKRDGISVIHRDLRPFWGRK